MSYDILFMGDIYTYPKKKKHFSLIEYTVVLAKILCTRQYIRSMFCLFFVDTKFCCWKIFSHFVKQINMSLVYKKTREHDIYTHYTSN